MQLEPVVSPSRLPPLAASLRRIAEPLKGVALRPDSRKGATFEGSPSPARQVVKTTPKARLRHDDSQIQFAAIESSPLQPEPVESQYLTDRQKEIKERQGREVAAMFPEITSSPRSTFRPTEYSLPKLVFKSDQNQAPEAAMEDTSPTYLPDPLMNEFLGSSPTPSSKRSSDRRSDDDPPSSPPFVSSHLQINQLAVAPLAHENHALVQAIPNAEEHAGNRFADESLPIPQGQASNVDSINAFLDAPRPITDQNDALGLKVPQVPVDTNPMSDFDIYVDAPSVPLLNQPSTECNDNKPKEAMSSFQSEGSSNFSVEDDQVTAQLITEMEHASSQRSTKSNETGQSAWGATKKRKRSTDSPNVNKKTKRTPASSDPLTAGKFPQMGETVAECVMIDVREADRSRPVHSQQIKRELSASPCIFTGTQVVVETPVVRPRDSGTSQSLSQGQDAAMMAKKAVGRPRGSRNSQAEKEPAYTPRKGTRVSERLSGSTTGSPHKSPAASQESTKGGPWLALGKTPGRGMFRWLRRSSAEIQDLETPRASSSANEGDVERRNEQASVQDCHRHGLSPADDDEERQITSYNKEGESVAQGQDGETQLEGSGGVEGEERVANAHGMLEKFQGMLDEIKRVTFGPEEERAMVGILFESVKEVHEAGRRHTRM